MALAELLFGRKDESFWEDREIRFDAPTSQLECRPGETVIEALVRETSVPSIRSTHTGSAARTRACPPARCLQDPVEDTKGNNGEPGELLITNLRLIWVSKKSKRTNISIGYNCVTNLQIKTASSRLKGQSISMVEALSASIPQTQSADSRNSTPWEPVARHGVTSPCVLK